MRKRIISAIVMIAIMLPIVIVGDIYFTFAVSALSVLALYEMIKVKEKEKKISDILKILAYVVVFLIVLLSSSTYKLVDIFSFNVFSGLFLLFFIPVVLINDDAKYNITDALYLIGSIIFIALAFAGMITIRDNSFATVIYLLLITIMTDTFALFTGMLIGKHKLCEKISPKKTIEGSIGGSLVGTIVPVLFYIFIIDANANIFLLIFITLCLSIIGQIGDLFFSSIKRHYGMKDFSKLIPGHGGVLDRLDSFIFVVLTYLILMNFL